MIVKQASRELTRTSAAAPLLGKRVQERDRERQVAQTGKQHDTNENVKHNMVRALRPSALYFSCDLSLRSRTPRCIRGKVPGRLRRPSKQVQDFQYCFVVGTSEAGVQCCRFALLVSCSGRTGTG